ncbi:hypothetical protein ACQPZP_26040 [Spirillospora sp. CA-142024]|uniref:hypothetical protein n=1 Tax=Spirillospora sp. CA-142024 TaxID=3240036 RepID=UPI003D8B91EB
MPQVMAYAGVVAVQPIAGLWGRWCHGRGAAGQRRHRRIRSQWRRRAGRRSCSRPLKKWVHRSASGTGATALTT